MIIAVDFDGTLCEHDYPEIGKPNIPLIVWLKKKQRQGAQLILWTCRSGRELEEAIDWAEIECGLVFSAVNEDLPEIKNSKFGQTKSCKVFAHLYIDDKNIGKDLVWSSEYWRKQ